MFVIYDGRACADQGTDEAAVMVMEDTLEAARESAKDYGQCAIYEYDEEGDTLINERWVEDVG